MDDLKALALFVAIAEEQSLSAAARRLGMSAPAATRRLTALESELGCRLFNRTTRQVSLTEEGRLLKPSVVHMLETAEQAKHILKKQKERPQGILNLTTTATLAQRFIIPYLSDFYQRYPDVKLGIKLSDSLVDIVSEGIDIALRAGWLEDSSLIAKQILIAESVVCASPNYIDKYGMPNQPKDLSKHTCLFFQERHRSKKWCFDTPSGQIDVAVDGVLSVNEGDALRRAAIDGVGIILVPKWLVSNELASGELKPLLQEYSVSPKDHPLNVLYPSRMFVPRKVRVFIDFLQEKLNIEQT